MSPGARIARRLKFFRVAATDAKLTACACEKQSTIGDPAKTQAIMTFVVLGVRITDSPRVAAQTRNDDTEPCPASSTATKTAAKILFIVSRNVP
ncbi:MAG TPA: hypothetical protein VNS63_08040 [Blastocatellia bacterium]|nr:hypothetical protein [Blastocatellia bacterium]